jgi:hypothetical protein
VFEHFPRVALAQAFWHKINTVYIPCTKDDSIQILDNFATGRKESSATVFHTGDPADHLTTVVGDGLVLDGEAVLMVPTRKNGE